jgi:hypothetical protein
MVEVELHDNDDNLITQVDMHHAPAVGDVLWLCPHREKSVYKVKEICHWVSDSHEYHRVCVYVETI